MRGAVLYRLGLKVDERVMRRHYGVQIDQIFIDGVHPEEFKEIGNDGTTWCTKTMRWLARKVDLPSLLQLTEIERKDFGRSRRTQCCVYRQTR